VLFNLDCAKYGRLGNHTTVLIVLNMGDVQPNPTGLMTCDVIDRANGWFVQRSFIPSIGFFFSLLQEDNGDL
jgi:hypothetical protein